MKYSFISPFKPKYLKDIKPKNIKIYTFNAGFKKKNEDLLILVFDNKVSFSAAYSKTSTPSAPIIWDKKNNKGICKILIVNSGNANAHTGQKGISAIKKYVKIASDIFNCKKNEIIVSSTGVIGEQIDPFKIIKKIKNINLKSSKSIIHAAKAIMTTDTFPKTAIANVQYNSDKIKIFGFAKGSGMIAPNMGTMLSYIFIEAPLNQKELNILLRRHLDNTFNSISVDGDTSTSDTIVLFSTGFQNNKIKMNTNLFKKISFGVEKVMLDLSKKIVSDGEGISKLIEVEVINAKSIKQAKKVAFSIGESILVKTAVAGEDANWGRVIMAIGKADKEIHQNKIIIKFGNLIVAKEGEMYKNINIKKLDSYMRNKIINIKVNLNIGKYNKKVWTSDLTHDYITINADYRS